MKADGMLPEFARLPVFRSVPQALIRLSHPFLRAALRMMPVPAELKVRRYRIPGWQGRPMGVEVIAPRGAEGCPCLIDLHGGAFCFGAAPYHRKLAFRYAMGARCTVVFPDYHLLPGYPCPAAWEDARLVYAWVGDHARELGIDRSRMAVCGDSAGGALAAYVCAGASERLSLQMLLYPVTDARMTSASMARFTDTPLWNAPLNRDMWRRVLHGVPRAERSAYSPMEAPLPACLPDTYLETAEFDCLHDEGVAYAHRLADAGVRVTLRETPGTVHGYDFILNHPVTQACICARIEALTRAFERHAEGER